MGSGGAFHRAYPRATQQAFLEGHELGFRYFAGVFGVLRYDNLTGAVKKILRGYRRVETERFIAFRSHWKFQAEGGPNQTIKSGPDRVDKPTPAPSVLSQKYGHYLRWMLPDTGWTLESINEIEHASTVLALATSNFHRPYGFGRNGTVFGVAPLRNEEHWLVVAPPNPAPLRSET
jgi:hypothetical protein